MIDIRKLKELVKLMKDNELTELDLRDSEEQVTLRRPNPGGFGGGGGGGGGVPAHLLHAPMNAAMPGMMHHAAPVSAGGGAAAAASDDEAGLLRIESPMVGTFYSAANPDSPAFASVGMQVTPDKVVCIIEAMKIFNEIKAECSGTIHKIMVKNGAPVEFGQTLFLVKPG